MGRGDDPDTEVGPLIRDRQVRIVEDHVAEAVAEGAELRAGGRRVSPTALRDFYEPTVLAGVRQEMRIMREETFGPVLPIMAVEDDEEAVDLANDSRYGLAASVWTRDPKRADRITRLLEAGAVNQTQRHDEHIPLPIPMSGWKQSGVGSRSGGAAGMLKFCRQQSVVSERISLASEPHWFPYVPRKSKIQARLVRLLGAHDWRRRLGRSPRR